MQQLSKWDAKTISQDQNSQAKGDGSDCILVEGEGSTTPKRAKAPVRTKRGASNSISVGTIVRDPDVDNTYAMTITNKCTLPIISDFNGEDSVGLAGDLVIVNCKKSGVCSAFEIDKSFEITEGGCLAALVADWNNEHPNVLVRRQLANDRWDQCSGPVESFPIESIGTIENHLLQELRSHAFIGFHFTSTDFCVPFVTAWFSARRRNANNSTFLWDRAKDPKMTVYKERYLSSLPCSLSRFDIVSTTSETMQALNIISNVEAMMLETVVDPNERKYELLILQYMPELQMANWNHVSVIILSNWRVCLAKSLHDDFSTYLHANLWYLDRFDFDNLMFQLAGTVEIFSMVQEYVGARRLHEILVRSHVCLSPVCVCVSRLC